MKMIKKRLRILRPAIFILIGLAFAFMGAAIGSINAFGSGADPSAGSGQSLGAAALYQIQLASPTPTVVKAVSIPGSTDQIMLMGIIITVIVTLPVLFRRSTWTNK